MRTDQGLTVWRTEQGLTVWRTEQGLTVLRRVEGHGFEVFHTGLVGTAHLTRFVHNSTPGGTLAVRVRRLVGAFL